MTRRTTTGSGWQWLGAGQTQKVWVAFVCSVKRRPMAQADRQEKRVIRLEIANTRVTTAERAHLHKVARDRQTTLSGLIRQSLRDAGAMPAE